MTNSKRDGSSSASGPSAVRLSDATFAELGLPELNTIVAKRYQLQAVIARGGMGVVYEAQDLDMNREVAIKILPPVVRAQKAQLRFLRECQLTASVSHPHVVRIYDAGFHDDRMPYLAMERMYGQTLAQRVKARGRLSVKAALHITSGLAQALAACHAGAVFHRDVKPGNVFIRSRPQRGVVLFDFGLSISGLRATRLTGKGVVVGTPAYMAPEQVTGAPVDARTDVYGAGAAGYFALVGTRPIASGVNTVSVVFDAILDTTPALAHTVQPSIPADVSQVFARALAKRPEDRFETALELHEACLEALAAIPAPTTPTTPEGHTKR